MLPNKTTPAVSSSLIRWALRASRSEGADGSTARSETVLLCVFTAPPPPLVRRQTSESGSGGVSRSGEALCGLENCKVWLRAAPHRCLFTAPAGGEALSLALSGLPGRFKTVLSRQNVCVFLNIYIYMYVYWCNIANVFPLARDSHRCSKCNSNFESNLTLTPKLNSLLAFYLCRILLSWNLNDLVKSKIVFARLKQFSGPLCSCESVSILSVWSKPPLKTTVGHSQSYFPKS